jgi:hypothetical protein
MGSTAKNWSGVSPGFGSLYGERRYRIEPSYSYAIQLPDALYGEKQAEQVIDHGPKRAALLLGLGGDQSGIFSTALISFAGEGTGFEPPVPLNA